MPRKGVSLQEKRERILRIYHESKEVFNLKEVEKLGSKAGVVLQTVKDVNQALVDDALVDCDKIGSGNYFWSFPSKLSQSRKRKLSELEQRRQTVQEKLAKVKRNIEEQKLLRSESDERLQKLRRLEEQKTKVTALRTKVQHLAENDPAILQELEGKVRVAKEGSDRWTDNVYTLKSWVVKKRGVEGKEVDKWLGIKDDFDYVE
ncbi:meiotic nuclear division protein, putative [Phytophthora infestans T30-4]|uniref:Meiotic nuclear division protein, putative n=2 Tax=Phytophthora infestans TaxID=4787 RepID=D0MUZ4_PHYIT|nr:meiotic nuclear division protein, putative [Phytophthora infestans T30-4]EEY60990.1 meiotic nuclear division protein, putative [Phytophthora infestans T30-4]KAF4042678.1 Leucine zipper with capping helix domain [Phytophthora infestans]KAF4128043.1 Leucine zipper with capping helix domain [Phytophthora infestans]|eukprot:XP_002907907.1 meiotic nuclear division protein, putative [Phytophthora infestans T30-4]